MSSRPGPILFWWFVLMFGGAVFAYAAFAWITSAVEVSAI